MACAGDMPPSRRSPAASVGITARLQTIAPPAMEPMSTRQRRSAPRTRRAVPKQAAVAANWATALTNVVATRADRRSSSTAKATSSPKSIREATTAHHNTRGARPVPVGCRRLCTVSTTLRSPDIARIPQWKRIEIIRIRTATIQRRLTFVQAVRGRIARLQAKPATGARFDRFETYGVITLLLVLVRQMVTLAENTPAARRDPGTRRVTRPPGVPRPPDRPGEPHAVHPAGCNRSLLTAPPATPPTPPYRARREQVRLQPAGMFTAGSSPPQVVVRLRV
ncbi:hypothetical protein FRAHR75_570039 [Frankia sp. Hr75.2]|nr:hypothetical protein FRAHR75_570039 [Frankia sp. Hr75.2]